VNVLGTAFGNGTPCVLVTDWVVGGGTGSVADEPTNPGGVGIADTCGLPNGGATGLLLDATVMVDAGDCTLDGCVDRCGVANPGGLSDCLCARPRGVFCCTSLCIVDERFSHSLTPELEACSAAIRMLLVTV